MAAVQLVLRLEKPLFETNWAIPRRNDAASRRMQVFYLVKFGSNIRHVANKIDFLANKNASVVECEHYMPYPKI